MVPRRYFLIKMLHDFLISLTPRPFHPPWFTYKIRYVCLFPLVQLPRNMDSLCSLTPQDFSILWVGVTSQGHKMASTVSSPDTCHSLKYLFAVTSSYILLLKTMKLWTSFQPHSDPFYVLSLDSVTKGLAWNDRNTSSLTARDNIPRNIWQVWMTSVPAAVPISAVQKAQSLRCTTF
jgi:hypothetical protein